MCHSFLEFIVFPQLASKVTETGQCSSVGSAFAFGGYGFDPKPRDT